MTEEFWIGECSTVLSVLYSDVELFTYEQFFLLSFIISVWLSPPGLDKIYELTNTPTQYDLRFDLGLGSERVYAVYDNFKIAPVKQKFKLTIGKYSGNAGGPFASKVFAKLPAIHKTDTEKTA